MVGTLFRLQLKLFTRSMKGSTARLVSTIIIALYVGGLVAAATFALVLLRDAPDILGPLSVIAFGGLSFVWPIGSVMISSGNALADAGRFALFPVTAKRLVPGLLVAGLVGIGSVAMIVLGIGLIVGWSTDILATLFAVVGVVLGLLICLLMGRSLTAALSVALQRRRVKEATALAMLLGIFGLLFGMQWVTSRLEADTNQLVEQMWSLAGIVGWTPFGWAWSLPLHAFWREWTLLGIKLVLSVALIAVLWAVWAKFLDRDLTSPLEVGGDGQRVKQGGLLDRWFPNTPAGAIARRSVRYWRRDTRRFMQLVAVGVMPLFMMVPIWLNSGDVPSEVLVFVPIISALMVGSAIAWDISYDGSSIWMQISAGVTGKDDRLGRSLAFLAIFGPYFLVILAAFSIWSGEWGLLPGVLGACIAGVGTGIGVGSWVGSVWQTAMPTASGNIFKTSSGGGFETLLGSMLTLIVPLTLTGLVTAGAAAALWFPWATWVALAVGIAIGAGMFWAGIVLGGRTLDRKWPEVLKKVTWEGE